MPGNVLKGFHTDNLDTLRLKAKHNIFRTDWYTRFHFPCFCRFVIALAIIIKLFFYETHNALKEKPEFSSVAQVPIRSLQS